LEKLPAKCYDKTDGPGTATRGETILGRHSYQQFSTAEHMETVPCAIIRAIMTLDDSEM
jgi:hypothetical protein